MSTPIRILIADDDASLRRELAAAVRGDTELELVGAAANAEDAGWLASQRHPDVALLGATMPGGSARAADEVRRAAPGVAVVALTEEAAEMLAGVDAALGPDATPDQIRATVHEAARARRTEPEELEASREGIVRVLEEGLIDVVFQAVVDLRDGRTVGYEALARFPGGGSPAAWFEEAERLGLHTELEVAAVHRALELARDLSAQSFLSLNVSPDAAASADLVEALAALPAGQAIVEVNEQAAITNHKRLGVALASLRAAGVQVALDDAGAGAASLRHVVRLGPDYVKLDGNLTRNVDADRARRAVATGLISCAAELEVAIVAKGVETSAQAERLRLLGARFGQGYYFARPGALPGDAHLAPPRAATG
jgi:EAL domain-containing protein (putative c-di-GMP-specific phosphodiesterase class I)